MADGQSGAGGCKAPIAIAVMMGRALGVQLYGKHEFFAWHAHHQLPAAAHCPGWSIWRVSSKCPIRLPIVSQPLSVTMNWDGALESLLECESVQLRLLPAV